MAGATPGGQRPGARREYRAREADSGHHLPTPTDPRISDEVNLVGWIRGQRLGFCVHRDELLLGRRRNRWR